jgi:hypothetical protein
MKDSPNSSPPPNESESSGEKAQETQNGVGYGRPPKHGQFRKNQSGNPKGRKPGSKNVLPLIWDVYNRPTKVRSGNGKTRTVPAIVALHEMQMAMVPPIEIHEQPLLGEGALNLPSRE